MKDSQTTGNGRIDERHSLSTWARIYLHGALAFAVLYAVAYIVLRLTSAFEFTGSRPLAMVLAVSVILIGPPLVGSVILFGVFPLIRKREAWRGILGWDDRLISEVASAKEKARVVIINWPNERVRTMGVMTSSLVGTADSERQFACVYVPTAPQTKLGYIRIVPVEDVEFTD